MRLDEPPAARREVLAEIVVGPAGDLDDEVVGQLDLGHDPRHGEQEAQVRSDGRLQQDLLVDQFLDLRVEGADDLLAFGQHPGHLVAAGQEGIGRPRQVLSDHGEQLDDPGFNSLQLTLKFLPVLRHAQPIRPVT